MSRFKRVLLAALAEQGGERPIPSKVPVQSSPPIGERTFYANFGRPRRANRRAPGIVREAFDLHTPQDTRQTRYERFKAARDRAEQLGLLQAGNIDGATYLWLTRPDPEAGEGSR